MGNFGDDAPVIAGFAGDVAESGNIGGSTALFFEFGRRKVVAAGDGDVFEVRPEFDFLPQINLLRTRPPTWPFVREPSCSAGLQLGDPPFLKISVPSFSYLIKFFLYFGIRGFLDLASPIKWCGS